MIIVLNRLEGPTTETRQSKEVGTFMEANRVLREYATTAPDGGAYDKVEFTISDRSDNKYRGTFYLKNEHKSKWDMLQHHMINACNSVLEDKPNDEAMLYWKHFAEGRIL